MINSKQHAAADYAVTDASMHDRFDTGRHATASAQPAVNEDQASDRRMHSVSNRPAPEDQGASLGQHAHTVAGQYESASGLHRQPAPEQDGPKAIWQGHLGQPGSPAAPMQLAASTAAMLSLVQQANQPAGSMQQGKRKQAGECWTQICQMCLLQCKSVRSQHLHCCYAVI